MGRNPKVGKKSQDRRPRPSTAGGRPRRGRPKICIFCSEQATWVDYKDVNLLKRFINDRGRIKARGGTGTCAQHQRDVASAVKTARELAMLPYSVRTMSSESRSPRGGDRRGGGRGPTAEDGSVREMSEESSDSTGRIDDSDDAPSSEVADNPTLVTP
jgi:small subunit ribosomal protein S18